MTRCMGEREFSGLQRGSILVSDAIGEMPVRRWEVLERLEHFPIIVLREVPSGPIVIIFHHPHHGPIVLNHILASPNPTHQIPGLRIE